MLRKLVISAGAFALALSSAPALAQGKGIDCMANSYTASQRARMAEIGPDVSFGDGGTTNAAADELGDIAMAAVEQCLTRHGWTQEQAMYAAFYELGRVSEAGFRASGELTPEQLRRIDEALATGDRSRLWAAVERGLTGGMVDDGSGPPPGDAIAMGAFVLGAGIEATERNGERVGILLGFMGLQRLGRREFLALQ